MAGKMNKYKKSGSKVGYFPILMCFIMISSGLGIFPPVGEYTLGNQDYNNDIEYQGDDTKPICMNFKDEGTSKKPELIEINLQTESEIISTNIPPVADAGPDQTGLAGEFTLTIIFFNGSYSYDPDGTIVNYDWDFGDGNYSSGITVLHIYSIPGIYIVTLTVTDNQGANDTDTAIVTISKASVGNTFTDKYYYNITEPINITYGGPHGDPGWWAGPNPVDLHFIIKNEDNETVVEEPVILEIGMTVFWNWHGTVNWEWNQTYRLYNENKTPDNLISPSGEQVPSGKYYVWFDTHSRWGLIGPAEFEIIDPSDDSTEPLKITTDKYTYYLGEPVHITITGDRVGPSSDFHRGYLIKDEYGHWVRDPPQLHSTDIHHSRGPDNYTWYQKYEILYDYDMSGNYQIHYPNDGEQVLTGKYYIYPYPGKCEPAEIEIIERPGLIIEKEKISGPDEIPTHTYHEWELKITVSGASPTKSYENVVVYDVLPAELTLLEFELSQGTLTETKKGKGKMGATHLLWDVGNLENEAELIIKIATRKNPAGKQEFTSPGTYFLNEGAWLKYFDNSTQENIEKGPTDPILVIVLEG
jgi:PKD repeat protein